MTDRLLQPGNPGQYQTRAITEKLLMNGPAIRGSLIMAE
jgi:hypothetical protein